LTITIIQPVKPATQTIIILHLHVMDVMNTLKAKLSQSIMKKEFTISVTALPVIKAVTNMKLNTITKT
jgi:hypothetical protein